MEQEIVNQRTINPAAFRHIAAAPGTVVDVAAGAFNASNAPLFIASVQPRLSRFIDERNDNGCYHLEL